MEQRSDRSAAAELAEREIRPEVKRRVVKHEDRAGNGLKAENRRQRGVASGYAVADQPVQADAASGIRAFSLAVAGRVTFPASALANGIIADKTAVADAAPAVAGDGVRVGTVRGFEHVQVQAVGLVELFP